MAELEARVRELEEELEAARAGEVEELQAIVEAQEEGLT